MISQPASTAVQAPNRFNHAQGAQPETRQPKAATCRIWIGLLAVLGCLAGFTAAAQAADLGFYVAADANGTRQVFFDGRQQTFGPENKNLLRQLDSDKAAFEVEVKDPRYENRTGIVVANRNPLARQQQKLIRVVLGYGQSKMLGHNGAVSELNPVSQAFYTLPPAAGKLLSLEYGVNFMNGQSGGVNPLQNGFANWPGLVPSPNPIVDAVSVSSVGLRNTNDSPALSAAIWVAEAHDWDSLFAVVALGRGATTLQVLSKPETATPSDFDLSRPSYQALASDLAWPANTLALVKTDADTQLNGPYIKVGAAGEGTWTRLDCYRNILSWLREFVAQARVQYPGYAVQVAYVPVLQGDDNLHRGTTEAAGLRMINQLERDLTGDIQAITGQAEPPLFGYGQTPTSVLGASGGMTQAYLQAALSNPGGRLFWGPEYVFDSYVGEVTGASDRFHLLPRGYIDFGEVIGIPYYEKVRLGSDSRILYPVAAVREGTLITATFHVPVGRLVVNPDITDPGFFGTTYTDSTHSAAIVAARIVGPAQIQYQLSAEPSGENPQLGFAFYGSGDNDSGTRSGLRSPLCDEADVYGRVSGKHWPTALAISLINVK